MSIKPVDFQIMFPRTTDMAKMYNDEHHRNQMQQQQQTALVRREAESNLKQVYSQDKPQEAGMKKKQGRDQRGKNDNKKREKNGKNKSFESDIKTSTIDIRL